VISCDVVQAHVDRLGERSEAPGQLHLNFHHRRVTPRCPFGIWEPPARPRDDDVVFSATDLAANNNPKSNMRKFAFFGLDRAFGIFRRNSGRGIQMWISFAKGFQWISW
jgi:hypothetical protein